MRKLCLSKQIHYLCRQLLLNKNNKYVTNNQLCVFLSLHDKCIIPDDKHNNIPKQTSIDRQAIDSHYCHADLQVFNQQIKHWSRNAKNETMVGNSVWFITICVDQWSDPEQISTNFNFTLWSLNIELPSFA